MDEERTLLPFLVHWVGRTLKSAKQMEAKVPAVVGETVCLNR